MAAEDPPLICPLDEAHQILKSRMQYHIVRCMKNHDMSNKMICPYNAIHIVDKIHFGSHIRNCPDIREIQSFQCTTDDRELPGTLTMDDVVRHTQEAGPFAGENWDDDPYPSQTYDPEQHIVDRPIIRTLIGASKAKRRQFRMQERMRMAQFDNGPPPPPSKVEDLQEKKKSMEPLRPPRATLKPDSAPPRPPKLSSAENSEGSTSDIHEPKANFESYATVTEKKLPKSAVNTSKLDQVMFVSSVLEPDVGSDVSAVEKRLKQLDIIKQTVDEEKKKLKELLSLPRPSSITCSLSVENLDSEIQNSLQKKVPEKPQMPKRKPVLSKDNLIQSKPIIKMTNIDPITFVSSGVESGAESDSSTTQNNTNLLDTVSKTIDGERQKLNGRLTRPPRPPVVTSVYGLTPSKGDQVNKENVVTQHITGEQNKVGYSTGNFAADAPSIVLPIAPGSSMRPSLGRGKGRGTFWDFSQQPADAPASRGQNMPSDESSVNHEINCVYGYEEDY